MRIAVFTPQAAPMTFIDRQVEGLRSRGHDVQIVPDVTLSAVDPGRSRALFGLLRRPAVWGRTLRVLRRTGLGPTTWALRTLAAVGWRLHCDVSLAHFGPQGAHAADVIELARPGGAGLAVVFHGYDMSSEISRAGADVYEHVFRRPTTRLLPVSGLWARRLVDLGADPAIVQVVRVGLEVPPLDADARSWDVPARPTLLFVGRLVEKKGLDILLSAMSELAAAINLRVVGDGPRRQAAKAAVAEMGIEDRVEFVGWTAPRDVLRLMAEADVVVVPSRTSADGDMEGIPTVAMEAMAVGTPVVATTHSGLPELITDRVSGLLVAEGDPQALARAITEVLAMDEPARRALVEAAYDEVRSLHGLDATLDQLEEALGGLVAADRGASATGD